MKAFSFTVAMALIVSSGCTTPIGASQANGHASVRLVPTVQAGAYRTQAEITPYGQADIVHLQVKIFELSNGSEVPVVDAGNRPLLKDIPNANLAQPIAFGNLNFKTTYRIRAYAYGDAGTASLISDSVGASYVDLPVESDDRPQLAPLPVKLIDRVFDGQATSAVTISSGSVTNAGSESIRLAP
ncbi:hypothetical protein J7643_10080 [bacterium]|nr:hypothetical protein [bacterium]